MAESSTADSNGTLPWRIVRSPYVLIPVAMFLETLNFAFASALRAGRDAPHAREKNSQNFTSQCGGKI